MFGKKDYKEIATEFINMSTGKVFARTKIPVDLLPDSFEIDTTLDMGSDKWIVLEAVPAKKLDFSQSGKLSITLKKIETIDPANILYSIPTIENTFCDLIDQTETSDYFSIHEDDWRQAELISMQFEKEIQLEKTDIDEIRKSSRVDSGFRKIHLRTKIPSPLLGVEISRYQLESFFGSKSSFKGFSIGRTLGKTAKDSFAFETSLGSCIWGIMDSQGNVTTICFTDPVLEKARIDEFCKEKQLIFVDWLLTEHT